MSVIDEKDKRTYTLSADSISIKPGDRMTLTAKDASKATALLRLSARNNQGLLTGSTLRFADLPCESAAYESTILAFGGRCPSN